jgi:hypothetical protein
MFFLRRWFFNIKFLLYFLRRILNLCIFYSSFWAWSSFFIFLTIRFIVNFMRYFFRYFFCCSYIFFGCKSLIIIIIMLLSQLLIINICLGLVKNNGLIRYFYFCEVCWIFFNLHLLIFFLIRIMTLRILLNYIFSLYFRNLNYYTFLIVYCRFWSWKKLNYIFFILLFNIV